MKSLFGATLANKCDGKELEILVADFYQMGVDQVLSCSALHGRGVKPLIEEILIKLPFYEQLVTSLKDQHLKEEMIQAELEQEYKKGFAELEQAEDWFQDDKESTHDRLTEKVLLISKMMILRLFMILIRVKIRLIMNKICFVTLA